MALKRKIVIIGAGHVGCHCARALAAGRVCDEIVLVDKVKEKAKAQAMDVADALSFPSIDITVRDGDLEECADADITVIAIGKPREKGQTRLDLLGDSVLMAKELAADLKKVGVGGIVISITNPADIIADYIRKALGLDRFRAFGTGTLLDTARLLRILSEQTGVSRKSISAFVLGEHGDSSMVPASVIRIGGLSAEAYEGFDPEAATIRTHQIGMDIINGKGSTEFGIGQALAFLANTILQDAKAVLPVSVHLEGEYGIEGINCGIPCVIGRAGIERIVELPLTDFEKEQLLKSAAVLKKHTELAQNM
ncbi:MAG: L-lactate dehydrogenase [Lachnospiraceae bacterium]|nr:L-lactate dehydrogenase [Lachnospiraceae bacterium]